MDTNTQSIDFTALLADGFTGPYFGPEAPTLEILLERADFTVVFNPGKRSHKIISRVLNGRGNRYVSQEFFANTPAEALTKFAEYVKYDDRPYPFKSTSTCQVIIDTDGSYRAA